MHETDVHAVLCLLLCTHSHAEVEADLSSEPQQGKQRAADCPVRCGIENPVGGINHSTVVPARVYCLTPMAVYDNTSPRSTPTFTWLCRRKKVLLPENHRNQRQAPENRDQYRDPERQ